ncbi:hypothetical protein FGO68_gene17552 [Halteria grandinella]|uniref:Uncharacterized protein n=1 Tax=Halteria grandinella TaxID=5974 RepID=A0A8J8NCT7_HALGN|nr:hypothetical protein FGO68_gene17552 [Halteria grandinella]
MSKEDTSDYREYRKAFILNIKGRRLGESMQNMVMIYQIQALKLLLTSWIVIKTLKRSVEFLKMLSRNWINTELARNACHNGRLSVRGRGSAELIL